MHPTGLRKSSSGAHGHPPFLSALRTGGVMVPGASHVALAVKNPPTSAGRRETRVRFLRRARQPCPAFLPGGSHGQRGLAGHSPWVLGASVRTSAHGKGHEEGSLAYAKA